MALFASLVLGGCRTTVYVSDLSELPVAARSRLGGDSLTVARLIAASPADLQRLSRNRRAAGEILAALSQRDAPQLSARYGLRYDAPQSAALLRLVDRRSGPASLEIRSLGDPTEQVRGTQVVLGLNLQFLYHSIVGRSVTRHATLDLYCLPRDNGLEIVAIVPTASEFEVR